MSKLGRRSMGKLISEHDIFLLSAGCVIVFDMSFQNSVVCEKFSFPLKAWSVQNVLQKEGP